MADHSKATTPDAPDPSVPEGFYVLRLSSGTVTKSAWECPRCHRINAPWMPYCDCEEKR